MNRYRRKKSNRGIRNEKEDRISSLPDSLLLHILSFLDDTKETVKTCVLSKRWQFVWADLSEINLSELNYDDEELFRFVDYVGRMIAMCRSLNKFSIEIEYQERLASNINNWISFAIENKVKDITLEFCVNKERYNLPQMLFSYPSLSKLTVSYCDIAPLGIIAWSSLESLTISQAELLDSVMDNILSNCPILKILDICNCWGLNYLNIKSPNLTTLTYEDDEGNDIPDISAPYLLKLSISSDVPGRQYKLINVSSLVQATIEFYNSYSFFPFSNLSTASTMNHVKQLLEILQSVEILKIGPQFSEIVSVLDAKSWKLPSFTKLRSLTLEVYNHEMTIPGILAILRSSPNLRTLRIEGHWKNLELDQYGIYVKDCNMDSVAPHLKTVEFVKYLEAEHMLTLAQILLKCSMVLEKMVINLEAPLYSNTSIDYMEISKRLNTFPRASPKGIVVLP